MVAERYDSWPALDYGRPVDAEHPGYIPREADDELEENLRRGNVCFVLAPFGVGKTSLLLRTRERLHAGGIACAYVSLQGLAHYKGDDEAWVSGFLAQVFSYLDDAPPPELRSAEAEGGPLWRLASGLLVAVEGGPEPGRDAKGGAPKRQAGEGEGEGERRRPPERLVLLVDEIGYLVKRELAPTLREGFLSTLHGLVRRSQGRITYAAAGVATFEELGFARPSALESELAYAPASERGLDEGGPGGVSRAEIVDITSLGDFSLDELERKAPKGPGRGDALAWVRAIYHWTSGHPYMTARLVREIARDDKASAPRLDWDDDERQRHVKALILKLFAGENDDAIEDPMRRQTHLRLRQMAREDEEGFASALSAYRRVVASAAPQDIGDSYRREMLLRAGLVRPAKGGGVAVRCRAFAELLFDEPWIERNERALDRPLRPYVRQWIERKALPGVREYPKVMREAERQILFNEEEKQFLADYRASARTYVLALVAILTLGGLGWWLKLRTDSEANQREQAILLSHQLQDSLRAAAEGARRAQDEERRREEELRQKAAEDEAAQVRAALGKLDAKPAEVSLEGLDRLVSRASQYPSDSVEYRPWAEAVIREAPGVIRTSRDALNKLSDRVGSAEKRVGEAEKQASELKARLDLLDARLKELTAGGAGVQGGGRPPPPSAPNPPKGGDNKR
ncbi:MAG TPA: hypothetical protein VFS43_33540 [Polyangiaceae bacterium]|nr:hypothetical protein [Polyangiaceae bacterium]